MINKNGKEEKIKKYKTNRDKAYNELKNESINIFKILNLKLTKRLIYDILCQNCINFSEIKIDLEDIIYLYKTLCLEYYYNSIYNISNESLKEKLISLIKKLLNYKEIAISENKFFLYFFEQIEKLNNNQQIFNFNDLNLKNQITEEKLLEKFFCQNILYDQLLFLIDIINKEEKNETFIKYYFNIIITLLNNIINKKDKIDIFKSNEFDSEESYEFLLILKIMNIIYNYYCEKYNDNENKIIEQYNIPNNFHESMKELIKINLNKYFCKYIDIKSYLLIQDDSSKIMTKKTLFFIEFIFKYFDLCLLLFYKENLTNFFDYMINPEYKLLKQYLDYKLLTMEKFSKDKDYKEKAAFIYYLVELISSNDDKIKEIKNNKINLELSINNINEFKFKYKSNLYDITIQKKENINNEIFNHDKILVLCLDNNTKKFYFQDIIDFNDYLTYDKIYKLRVNDNIYLVPLKNIETCLYSIEHETKTLDGRKNDNKKNNNDNLNKISKYENIPKYSWNIGYGGNKYLLISEEDNKIYSLYNQNNYYKSIKQE